MCGFRAAAARLVSCNILWFKATFLWGILWVEQLSLTHAAAAAALTYNNQQSLRCMFGFIGGENTMESKKITVRLFNCFT